MNLDGNVAVDVAVDAEVEVYAKTGSLFSQTWRKLASKDINWLGRQWDAWRRLSEQCVWQSSCRCGS